jgi:hypothetical protein
MVAVSTVDVRCQTTRIGTFWESTTIIRWAIAVMRLTPSLNTFNVRVSSAPRGSQKNSSNALRAMAHSTSRCLVDIAKTTARLSDEIVGICPITFAVSLLQLMDGCGLDAARRAFTRALLG